jgi:hypothetical protein
MMLMRSPTAVDIWRRDVGTAQEPQRNGLSVAHHQTPWRHTSNILHNPHRCRASCVHPTSDGTDCRLAFRQNTVLPGITLPRATVQYVSIDHGRTKIAQGAFVPCELSWSHAPNPSSFRRQLPSMKHRALLNLARVYNSLLFSHLSPPRVFLTFGIALSVFFDRRCCFLDSRFHF